MLNSLNPKNDAYGQEIWAFFKGKESFEIVERDDGYFSASSGVKIYFSEYIDWPEHEKKALKQVKGKVLDVGCGAGRHSLYLQKNGFEVTGIDSSPLAIKACKERGLNDAMVLPLGEVEKLKPLKFDTIIMLGNNFGLFGSREKAKEILKIFYETTTSNALIIAETRDPYETDNPAHLEYQEFNKKRGRMPGQLRIRIRFEKHVGEWFDYLIVSKNEMKEILEGTGWQVKEFIDASFSVYVAIIEKINEK